MTEKKPFGWADRQRCTLQLLEEAIQNAREMAQAKTGRGHDKESRLEWSKTLMKLLELHQNQLTQIKSYLWPHPSQDSDKGEPGEEENGFVEFERLFQKFLQPLNQESLKLKCVDCGCVTVEVSERMVQKTATENQWLNLCPMCYAKRKTAEPPDEEEEDDEE